VGYIRPRLAFKGIFLSAKSKVQLVVSTSSIWLTRHCLQVQPSELLFTFSHKKLAKGKLGLKLLVVGDNTDEVPQRGKKRNAAVRAVVDPLAYTTLARTPLSGTPDSWLFFW
jgi:hypothetical protein